jgi:hypothetical protein
MPRVNQKMHERWASTSRRRGVVAIVAAVALAVLLGDWASYEYGSTPGVPAKTRRATPAATSTSAPAIAVSRKPPSATGRVYLPPSVPNSRPSVVAGGTTTSLPRAAPAVKARVSTTTHPPTRTDRTGHPATTTTTTTRPPARKVAPVIRRVSSTTTTLPPVYATHTSIIGAPRPPNELVAVAGTYCILCTTRSVPSGGEETISLVDSTSGAILATWVTTITYKEVRIVWTYTTTPTDVNFVPDMAIGNVTWAGPTSVLIPESDVAGNTIGVQASFSGSGGLSASHSSVAVIAI